MASSNGVVPPGFRFHPTDEELLHYYLKKKVSFQKFDMDVIREVDLNKMEPWELQEKCKIGSMPQNEWYFFSHKDRKYPTGSRTNRATSAGFWKATGRDKCIRSTFKKIGMRKTLVFYRGRAPHGQKTDWIMHEYRLEDGDDDPQANSNEDGWVVCRVFKKKNLFKIGNEGGSNMNMNINMNNPGEQQNPNTSSTNQHRTLMHRSENQYLMIRHQQSPGNPSAHAFELDKPAASGLALHYPHMQPSHHHHYSLFQPHQPNILSTAHKSIASYDYSAAASLPSSSDQSPLMVKQLMSNARDCESAGSEGLRYQVCEPGDLEVGTCDQQSQPIAAAARDDPSGMNEWGMLDRLVTSHEDGNASSANHIHHLTLRGEMDFWGYGKQ